MSGSVALIAENAISFPSGENETPGYPSWIPVCVTCRSPLPFGLTTNTLPSELNAISPFVPGKDCGATPAARARLAEARRARPADSAASRQNRRCRDGEADIEPPIPLAPRTTRCGRANVAPRPDRRLTPDPIAMESPPVRRENRRCAPDDPTLRAGANDCLTAPCCGEERRWWAVGSATLPTARD